MDHYDMMDMVSSHITARVPGKHDQFLINHGLSLPDDGFCLIRLDLEAASSEPYRARSTSRAGDPRRRHGARRTWLHRPRARLGRGGVGMECALLPSCRPRRFARGVAYHFTVPHYAPDGARAWSRISTTPISLILRTTAC
jgi:hypothetical protein